MSRVKRQHFVPCFYLRNFTSKEGGSRIHVYDKPQRKSFQASISKVASRRYFYDLEEIDMEAGEAQVVEKYLGRYETLAGAAINSLLNSLKNGGKFISASVVEDLSIYLPLQILRTEETRISAIQTATFIREIAFMAHLEREAPELAKKAQGKLSWTATEDFRKAVHLQAMFDTELREWLALRLFSDFYWIVITNETATPYYTSDHPVVHIGHQQHQWRSMQGFGCPGIEIAFPLSSKYLLVLAEREYFSAFKHLDRQVITANRLNVEYYNSLQIERSTMQIYCGKDSFDLVEDMAAEDDQICEPNRPRFENS